MKPQNQDLLDTHTSTNYYAVTPSDTADLPLPCRALVVGTSGTIRVQRIDGTQVDLPALPDGSVWNIAVKRVLSAGTTATNIAALS